MPERRYVLAVDQGTTNTKATVTEHNGSIVAISHMEHRQIYPKPGWVEQDPYEIWRNALACMKGALEKSGVGPEGLAAIGVTNQRESVVAWDPVSGRPLYNVIVWQDRRTSGLADSLRREHMKEIKDRTGLFPDAYFSATKIHWLLENVEGLREMTREGRAIFGTVDSWIIWNLTRGSRDVLTPEMGGAFVTDYSNASRTMLFDIGRLDWDDDLLVINGGIPRESLPLPRPSSDRDGYGIIGPEAASMLGVSDIPVAGDAGDQQAALFGQACYEPGEVKSTYGTGNFILMNTGNRMVKSKRLLSTVFYSMERGRAQYALEGSVFITGAAVQWLRDGLGLISDLGEIEGLADETGNTGGVYVVPAFTGLGAPHWDQYARGLIIGITGGTGRAQIARAVLESIAYLNRDVIEVMKKETGTRPGALRADGGAASNDFLMQFQADITGISVLRPRILETTSLGASYLAGLAVGLWNGLEELKGKWALEREFSPKMDRATREMLYRGWRAALRRSLGWAKEVPWAYPS